MHLFVFLETDFSKTPLFSNVNGLHSSTHIDSNPYEYVAVVSQRSSNAKIPFR